MSTSLDSVALALVAPGKGILAADESPGTLQKRFATIGLEPTDENGRRYREVLFTADGAARYVSGVILHDATIRQSTGDGVRFVDRLASQGILAGIKVDAGTTPLASAPGEVVAEGLDGLRKRLVEYRGMGATFAKWRAVIEVSHTLPSPLALRANAENLARYAALCQEEGIVPIVEPEVLMDGAHGIHRCEEVTTAALHAVFEALYAYDVRLEGMLLKPNMVVAGKQSPEQTGAEQVAVTTIRTLRRTVPAAVPGIVFLSGGQSDVAATAHLDAMARGGPHPWELSFSYGRALQTGAIAAWAGHDANAPAARAAYLHRARMNSLARMGSWDRSLERALEPA